MDVGSEQPLQVIKFDHPKSPTKHGWELIEGSEQDLLPYQRDPDHGRILRIKASQDFCMDYHVGVLQQMCKAIGFVVRSESNFAFYAEIRVCSQQGMIPGSKSLYCHVIEGSYPEQHPEYPNEYEVHVSMEQLKNGWVLMKIDLPEKAWEAAKVRDEEWEFDRLLMLRFKVSRGEVDVARIELYKENPWERPFSLQDASDYPDSDLRQPPAIPVSPAIRQLATIIRALREAGERPCTLLLGSSLSLMPEVRWAVCENEDWGVFWTAMQCLSAAERRALLVIPLDALNLAAGYRCLAQLVQAGYFDLVLTLNVDDALDESLRILPARECQIFTHGQVPGTEIAAALGRTHPRVKVVKLRGDINAYKLPLTPEGQFEFPEELEEAVERLLSQDTILVGDIPHDTDIQRCIRPGEGALWVVVPEEPRPGSFLYNAIRSRPGKGISGAEAEFVSFFSALARELGVESSEVSDCPRPAVQPSHVVAAPNPFCDRGRINDPAYFFDRQRILRELCQMLAAGNSVSLVGEQEIGKSSVLYRLYQSRAEWLPEATVLYLDLQGVLDEEDFCAEVLEELGRGPGDLRTLKRALRRERTMLLLDEVEKLADPAFFPRLHSLLRALAQEPTLTIAVASHLPLVEIFPPRDPTSPFHNIFTEKRLGPFAPDDVRAFLTRRLKGMEVAFTPEEIERLVTESGGHPARLQRLAYDLFEQKRR